MFARIRALRAMGRADAAIRRNDLAAARTDLELGLRLIFQPGVDLVGPLGLSLVTSLSQQLVRVLELQGQLPSAVEPLRRALTAFDAADAVYPIREKALLDWKKWAGALHDQLSDAKSTRT